MHVLHFLDSLNRDRVCSLPFVHGATHPHILTQEGVRICRWSVSGILLEIGMYSSPSLVRMTSGDPAFAHARKHFMFNGSRSLPGSEWDTRYPAPSLRWSPWIRLLKTRSSACSLQAGTTRESSSLRIHKARKHKEIDSSISSFSSRAPCPWRLASSADPLRRSTGKSYA